MSDNIKEFKKGDEVVLCLDYMGNTLIKQTKIKNITPKGIINTDSGDTFDRDGNYKTKERFKTVFGYILPYNNDGILLTGRFPNKALYYEIMKIAEMGLGGRND